MSLISKALNKIQDSRLANEKPRVGEIVYLTDAPQPWFRTFLIILLAAGTGTAILTSSVAIVLSMKNAESRQIQVLNLERTIKGQEKRINDFISTINKNQRFTDSQINDLNIRLKQKMEDNAAQFNAIALNAKDSYTNLKEAILDDKQQIESLNNYARSVDQKIDALSVSNVPPKDVPSPAIGN